MEDLYMSMDAVKLLLEKKMQEIKVEKEKILDNLETECLISYVDSKDKHKSKKERQYYKGYSDGIYKAIQIIKEGDKQ